MSEAKEAAFRGGGIFNPVVRIDSRRIDGQRAFTIVERLKELNAQFDMVWFNYDIRVQPNSNERLVGLTLSTKGMSVFIELKIRGLEKAMDFIKDLNFDGDPGLNLTQLWRWMRGENTELYGCIKEDGHA